jgi:hypothetical protein
MSNQDYKPYSVQAGSYEDMLNKQLSILATERNHYRTQYERLLTELRSKGAQGIPQPTNLPKPLIDRLIVFCHPDKHNNSNVSNELTRELLKIRA